MPTFLVADLVTGKIRDELPLTIAQDLTRLLMDVGTGDLDLPTSDPACPGNWDSLTTPWHNLVLACDDHARILWAGIPTARTRNPTTPVVTLQCVTVEEYLNRRYVPDLTYTAADQTSTIARALAGIAGDSHGIGLEYDTAASGVLRDRSYYDDESVAVLQRLQELAQVIGGFEWTVDVEWANDARTQVRKIFRTGYPNLGRVTDTPEAWFELPGTITQDVKYDESWSADDAATHVVATGDGEGESKTRSAPVVDTMREAAGFPRLEYRRSFSSVTDQATIDDHAQAVAAQLFGGQQVVTLSARADQDPKLGDWSLGDTVGIRVRTDTLRLDEVWRVVGYSLAGTLDVVTPTIARVGAVDLDALAASDSESESV